MLGAGEPVVTVSVAEGVSGFCAGSTYLPVVLALVLVIVLVIDHETTPSANRPVDYDYEHRILARSLGH